MNHTVDPKTGKLVLAPAPAPQAFLYVPAPPPAAVAALKEAWTAEISGINAANAAVIKAVAAVTTDRLYAGEDLTPLGVQVATTYSQGLVMGRRLLQLEREYPEGADLFLALRTDDEFAARMAS